jgi:hypothetical protein
LKLSVLLTLAVLITCSAAEGSRSNDAPSCRTRPDVVGKCFVVYGRLSVYNGTPSIRLWPSGSKRLLGVLDPNDISNAPGPTVLPGDIKGKLDWNKDMFGDFLVCPLSRKQAASMQTICIESGKRLIVREHKPTAK